MLNRRSTFNYVRETFLADEKIVFMRSQNQPVVPAASLLAHSACPQLQAMTSDYSTTTGAKTPKPAEMTVGSLDRPVRSEPASRTAEVAPLDIARVISEINDKLQDAFFDYDRSEVRPDAVTALQQDLKLLLLMLSDFPRLRVIIEGTVTSVVPVNTISLSAIVEPAARQRFSLDSACPRRARKPLATERKPRTARKRRKAVGSGTGAYIS